MCKDLDIGKKSTCTKCVFEVGIHVCNFSSPVICMLIIEKLMHALKILTNVSMSGCVSTIQLQHSPVSDRQLHHTSYMHIMN